MQHTKQPSTTFERIRAQDLLEPDPTGNRNPARLVLVTVITEDMLELAVTLPVHNQMEHLDENGVYHMCGWCPGKDRNTEKLRSIGVPISHDMCESCYNNRDDEL